VNSVEQAIRAALAKGDAGDQGFRRRIYGSASAALERSLTARSYTDQEISARRQSLLATIRHIESEFLLAAEANTPEVARVDVPVSKPRDMKPAETPTGSLRAPTLEPQVDVRAPAPESRKQEAPKPVQAAQPAKASDTAKIIEPRQSRPWLKYALNGAIVLALIVGGFWAYSVGQQIYIDATSPTPAGQRPALAESASSGDVDKIEWIQIFAATDTDLLSAPQGAKAEIASRNGTNYVVMTGDGSKEVAVKIGSGLMQTFAGKRVMFNFKARSTNGTTLDTGMHCEFSADTKCERKRFKISPETAEYMFAVNVAASAKADGALLIAPDLTGGGGTVEIENIRATIVVPDAG
jgi:outer membrane biosynthesis protein TonB